MKYLFRKLNLLLVVLITLYACENEQTQNEIPENISNELSSKAPCGAVNGPECGVSGQNVTYALDPGSFSGSYNWSVSQGSMQLISGQGTTTATYQLGSNFNGGEIKVNYGGGNCTNLKTIAECNSSDPCGLSLSQVYELNGNQENELAFGTVPSLSSGWSITGSSFAVTFESNNTAFYNGSLNPAGYPQIFIPVYCSDRVISVTVTVTASSNSNSCSQTVTTNFAPVCGSGDGGFSGF